MAFRSVSLLVFRSICFAPCVSPMSATGRRTAPGCFLRFPPGLSEEGGSAGPPFLDRPGKPGWVSPGGSGWAGAGRRQSGPRQQRTSVKARAVVLIRLVGSFVVRVSFCCWCRRRDAAAPSRSLSGRPVLPRPRGQRVALPCRTECPPRRRGIPAGAPSGWVAACVGLLGRCTSTTARHLHPA